jgi:hypothetical protein
MVNPEDDPIKHFWGKWKSIICKQITRWLHMSQLKACVVYYFQKTYNANKNVSFNLGNVLVSGE